MSDPEPDEGQWTPLETVGGRTVMAAAYLRPDAVHTSYTSGVVWWDPSVLAAALHPGTLDPGGGGWSEPSALGSGNRSGAVAAFNSGFRIKDSLGGYFADGRTVRPLRRGAASLVFSSDGRVQVGAWGTEVGMGPGVVAVRQNLSLIVDGGRPVPGIDTNDTRRWGDTLGNARYVWRSGIGVRPDGTAVYAAGNRLTAATLAGLLDGAGCVRAMELDINPQWTSFVLFTGAQPANLLPDMQNSPRRYDTASSRDFVVLSR